MVERDGKRTLDRMRWGLVSSWWSEPLKELKLATFNAQTQPLPHPVSGYYESKDTPDGKQPWYFTARDGSPALTIAGLWDE